MAKQITATKKVGDEEVTRTFNKETWDLLPPDKGGFEQVKSAKAPKEVKEAEKDADKAARAAAKADKKAAKNADGSDANADEADAGAEADK